jgi:hypothetical protein
VRRQDRTQQLNLLPAGIGRIILALISLDDATRQVMRDAALAGQEQFAPRQ